MKRLIVFGIVGPAVGLCAALLLSMMMMDNWDFQDAYLPLGFFLVVSVFSGLLDGALSRATPSSIRMPLIALCGAALCASIFLVSSSHLIVILRCMAIGAICMGLCSWLSNKPTESALA